MATINKETRKGEKKGLSEMEILVSDWKKWKRWAEEGNKKLQCPGRTKKQQSKKNEN